jgi:hypothetical protein
VCIVRIAKYSRQTKPLFCAIAALIALNSYAGPVSVKPDEVERLRTLVSKDAQAAAQFAKLRSAADKALDDKPSPVEVIVSAGVLASDPAKVKTVAALGDMAKIEALAWTAVVTGEEKYMAKTRDFVLAWASVNKPDGNPINDTTLEPLIEAYDITRPGFTSSNRARIDQWLESLAEKIVQDHSKQPQKNWESHRIKIVGLAALVLQNKKLEDVAKQSYMKQMENNFDATGASVDFKERDALHYHLYAVRPLLTFACAEKRSGDNLYAYAAPNGVTLQKAVDFVVPFALGKQKHVEFEKTKGAFDKKRAAAGEDEYKPHAWEPRTALSLFTEAGCLNPSYDATATTIADTSSKYANWRSVLNALNR